jgi:hypothetical protein
VAKILVSERKTGGPAVQSKHGRRAGGSGRSANHAAHTSKGGNDLTGVLGSITGFWKGEADKAKAKSEKQTKAWAQARAANMCVVLMPVPNTCCILVCARSPIVASHVKLVIVW